MTKKNNEFKHKRPCFRIETLGCRVNQAESDALKAQLLDLGWTLCDEDHKADLQILNTCTVTSEAGRKTGQHLRRMRHADPEAFLVAWGCQVELGDRQLNCDLALGNRDKGEAVQLILQAMKARDEENFASGAPKPSAAESETAEQSTEQQKQTAPCTSCLRADDAPVETRFSRFEEAPLPEESRAFVKVQDGCYNHCTYCAIRLVRGRSRSREIQDVVQEVSELAQAGYREIQLSGIHLTAYGKDLEPKVDLGDLLLALDKISGVERIRLGSLEPNIIHREMIEKFLRVKTLAPHLHLALQSGSATVLKRMGRAYTKDEYWNAVKLLRELWPELELTTDLMVGFQGETEAEHQESMAFVRDVGFSDLHIFRYSPRPGTAAMHLSGTVPNVIKKQRADEAETLRDELHQMALARQIGKKDRVMIEGLDPLHGYTGTYLPCELVMPNEAHQLKPEIGALVDVKILKSKGDGLKAVILC